MSLYNTLISEIEKSKKSYGYLISILLPLFITAIITIILYIVFNEDTANSGYNQWKIMSQINFAIYMFLYPLYLTIIIFLATKIEHKSSGFKLLFSSASDKLNTYLSKYFLIVFWYLNSLLLACAFLYLVGNTLSYFYPELGFQNYNIDTVIIAYFIKMFLGCLGILSIQFFLSIFWKKFFLSAGTGILLVIISYFLNLGEFKFLMPYSYSYSFTTEFINNQTDIFTKDVWFSLIYSVLFLFLGYYAFCNKNDLKSIDI